VKNDNRSGIIRKKNQQPIACDFQPPGRRSSMGPPWHDSSVLTVFADWQHL